MQITFNRKDIHHWWRRATLYLCRRYTKDALRWGDYTTEDGRLCQDSTKTLDFHPNGCLTLTRTGESGKLALVTSTGKAVWKMVCALMQFESSVLANKLQPRYKQVDSVFTVVPQGCFEFLPYMARRPLDCTHPLMLPKSLINLFFQAKKTPRRPSYAPQLPSLEAHTRKLILISWSDKESGHSSFFFLDLETRKWADACSQEATLYHYLFAECFFYAFYFFVGGFGVSCTGLSKRRGTEISQQLWKSVLFVLFINTSENKMSIFFFYVPVSAQ